MRSLATRKSPAGSALKNSDDAEVKEFRENCIREGVPEELLDSSLWKIEPERAMGAGNKILQVAQADKLMAARPAFDPDAQREILHIFTEVNTDDPDMANRLVPLKKPQINDAIMEAQWASGSLMQGLPVAIKQGINHIDYVEALLVAMNSVINRIEASGGMATAQEITGLQNMANHTQQRIAIIAQDEKQKSRVKQYGDALGKMMNNVKAYAQRLQEQMAKAAEGAGPDPETISKIQTSQLESQAKLQAGAMEFTQDMVQKEQAFKAEQERKNAEFLQQMEQERLRAQAELDMQEQKTAAEIRRQNESKPKEKVRQQ